MERNFFMLHEYIVYVPYERVDEYVEKLNAVDIFNVYYETPIEVEADRNGYTFFEKNVEQIPLKIYAEPFEVESLPDAYFELITKALNVSKSEITYKELHEETWQLPFEDIDLENGWVICSPETKEFYKGKKTFIFEPQGAFGTGLHETTQDCLRILLDRDFTNQTVLDLGTGSGILSIAAALRHAKKVEAVDIEPVEREIGYNAELNAVSTINVIQADLLHGNYKSNTSYHLVIINIGGDETIDIVTKHHLLHKGSAAFLISGLVEWNEEGVRKLFEENGYQIAHRMQSNEWVTILFQKS
ncbi:50S ribosomal protein L11 methyltransferase [Bacillus taeanensis]|uniref:50S ribosomal protein L11 methyltransferase n=1 Tax=Bacillus taeanensis TaxID=273032 RepID=A0A366XYS7_9BACI|nr:50S ribosomal protein L11 methyltransferase [Bacillus taeanensis]RBW69081.1 50S ribosomal protein L11 methyltransferase [Bacillus taeanensis]